MYMSRQAAKDAKRSPLFVLVFVSVAFFNRVPDDYNIVVAKKNFG